MDGRVYCRLQNGLADIFINFGVSTPRLNFTVSSDRISTIASMLCACNSYIQIFRDRNSESLIYI